METVTRAVGALRSPAFFGLYDEIRRRDRIDRVDRDERRDVPAIEESSRVSFGTGVGPQPAMTARSATAQAIDFYRRVQGGEGGDG